WEVPPEHIHEMPDVIAALEAVLDHFLTPGAKVIVPTPAYMPFLKVPALHGRVIQEVGMLRDGTGRYRYDLAAREAAFDDGGAPPPRAPHVAPTPPASPSPPTARHTLTAVAAPKPFHLPGLKCAQLLTSNEADREHFAEVGHFARHGAANLGIAATSTAYDEG